MAKKVFDKFFVANLKRTAQMVSPMVRRKQKLIEEMSKIQSEIETLDTQIKGMDGHFREITGGYGVEDLIERVVEDTGKKDKDGNPVKYTKWVLKYPETIVPEDKTTEEPMAGVSEVPFEESTINGEVIMNENNNESEEFNI